MSDGSVNVDRQACVIADDYNLVVIGAVLLFAQTATSGTLTVQLSAPGASATITIW